MPLIRNNGFVVGTAGDQWIAPTGSDRLSGIISDNDGWNSFSQVLPILVIVSTSVTFGLAYTDAKQESRVTPSLHVVAASGNSVMCSFRERRLSATGTCLMLQEME